MSHKSTYGLAHSLPNRAKSRQPKQVSLQGYQSLDIDRDALEAAYQANISQPTSASVSAASGSTRTNASASSHPTAGSSGPYTSLGSGYSSTHPSSDGSHTTPGVISTDWINSHPPPGSSLPGSSSETHNTYPSITTTAPTPPPKPSGVSMSERWPTAYHPSPTADYRHSMVNVSNDPVEYLGSDGTDTEVAGYESDPGPVVGRRSERPLPEPPTNVPQPTLPLWEPDYKSQIPQELRDQSARATYAQLSAPPGSSRPGRVNNMAAPAAPAPAPATAPAPSGSSGGVKQNQNGPTSPSDSDSTAGREEVRVRPEAEKEVMLRATERTPLWTTHFLDPCLRDSTFGIPHQVTDITNIALSTLSSGPKTRYNQTIGAPIDGLAKAAKGWMIRPDGKFQSENGGLELAIGVIDGGMQGWAADKGRKIARVEVSSRHGGIKVDVFELSPNRQIDLKVQSKDGDVLILLPDNYLGPIHVNADGEPPVFLSVLQPQLKGINNPYASFYTTFVVPLAFRQDKSKRSRGAEHTTVANIHKYVPRSFREQSDIFDQVAGGYASHTRQGHSKVHVHTKGRVVIGYRDSKDEVDAVGLGLKVGAQNGGKKKRWWQGS